MPRQFVDLSIFLENDVMSDPPAFAPKIQYFTHEQTYEQIEPFFPGLKKEDLPDGEGWAVELVQLSTHNRRLHTLRRQSQRRFLLRFRRHQESVRHQGQAEFHRASPQRQVTVDRRGFEYRSQRLLDCGRTADERTSPQARSTHLGTMASWSTSIARAIRVSAAFSTPTTRSWNTTPASR